MTRIFRLEIKNYRGIRDLTLEFDINQNLICFIGRGDSGKTTILEAISSVLSPNWNLNFYDTDFYNCEINNNIEIIASILDFPESFLSENKFGLYVRGLDIQNNKIIDNFIIEESNDNNIPILSIKLSVDNSLEPKWVVTNKRDQEDKPISGADRANLNCYMISDFVDSHFSWNKGNPLYALLKSTNSNKDSPNENVIMQYLRDAKLAIDHNDFHNLDEATNLVKEQAATLGLNISDTKTTLDSRELSIKDGRISLHENSVPFRLKGKGSKRLASIAIQSAIVHIGGIMLIDEVEQGQEPDRIKQAVRSLKEHHAGQIFITTHSRDAICELGSEPLLLLLKNDSTNEIIDKPLKTTNEDLQKTIRACPEAFFAKKVIVCEGATEVGICRALDKWRRSKAKPPMSFLNCAYIDGTGNTLIQRVNEINGVGLKTALFCDSDDSRVNEQKSNWEKNGVLVFDCDDNLFLEAQIFQDLPWNEILKLADYVIDSHNKNTDDFKASLKAKCVNGSAFPENWRDSDTPEMRKALEKASIVDSDKNKPWFKTVHHGEALGDIIFNCFDEMSASTHLKRVLTDLSDWIDA